MSGKFKQKKRSTAKTVVLILIVILMAVAVFWLATTKVGEASNLPEEVLASSQTTPATDEAAVKGIILKEALEVKEIGNYTGIYVEDGSDDPVTGILMMKVTNITSEPIQYAQITLDLEGETAKFTVSALPAGGTAVLVEQNRMEYSKNIAYDQVPVECSHLAGFDRTLSLQPEKLQIQLLEGAMNLVNISGEEISGTLTICYKNMVDGIYHGGIAYRVRLDGGMKAGEIRQIMAEHIHQPGTEVIFVEITE